MSIFNSESCTTSNQKKLNSIEIVSTHPNNHDLGKFNQGKINKNLK